MPVFPNLKFNRWLGVILWTVGTQILNWSVGEDFVVDIGRKPLLQQQKLVINKLCLLTQININLCSISQTIFTYPKKSSGESLRRLTPASLNLTCTPEAASNIFASFGFMHRSIKAGFPLVLKFIRSL